MSYNQRPLPQVSSTPPPAPPPRPTNSIYTNGHSPADYSQSSRRPLPQPGLPPNPYPADNSNGSMSRNRSLPALPPLPGYSASIQSDDAPAPPARPPPPPSRPTARALPVLPPSRSASGNGSEDLRYNRPLPTPATYPQLGRLPSIPNNRQVSLGTNRNESPPNFGSSSSLNHPYSQSPSPGPSRSTSQSHRTEETGLTSLGESFLADENDDPSFALRPPSRGEPFDRHSTPTQSDWRRPDPQRQISSFTLGDSIVPTTPTTVPMRTLNHQKSFLDPPQVEWPVAHTPSPSSRPETRHTSSQNSSSTGMSSLPSTNRVDSWRREHAREQSWEPPQRQMSTASSLYPPSRSSVTTGGGRRSTELSPSWHDQTQPPSRWVQNKLLLHQADDEYDDEGPSRRDDEWEDEQEEAEDEVNEIRFFNPALLSETALQLKDKVPKGRHVKAGIAWVGSFTGRDLVSFLPPHTRENASDRRFALSLAQSLQNQLWFVEVDWDVKPMRDSAEDVFRFMGEMGNATDVVIGELPSGLETMATKCYSPSCQGDGKCYSPRCPHRISAGVFLGRKRESTPISTPTTTGDWTEDLDPLLLRTLTEDQINRQTVIRQAITAEEQYEADLSAMEKLFITPLRNADPPVIPWHRLDTFIFQLFSNAMELREACKRLIENFAIRQREQYPLIQTVGDIFLEAAADFRNIYPEYTGSLPTAEKVLKEEMESNPEFRLFVERVVRQTDRRMDIKYLITRPSAQLQRYPAVIEAILNSTPESDPDHDFLVAALSSIQNLSAISQLKLFHASKGRGPAGKMQWFDLVPEEQRNAMPKKEQKRQMQVWELIQGEMEYVADLETIETLFINGLREADTPIIERSRLEIFLDDAFHNYRSLLDVHSFLLENLQARQMEQHPHFGMISDLILDAALNWQDAYMEYVTHYPIAKAKIQEEQNRNPRFAAFLETCLKNASSNRQDIYHFVNRPVPRLLRYPLLLQGILESLKETGPENHPDIETIPQILDLISQLGKATQKGVAVNESKVELWTFQHSLDGGKYGYRAVKDLDLLNPMRELIHKGKVFRQPEGSIAGSWAELYVLLFDNYFVLVKHAKSRDRDREKTTKYYVNRRVSPPVFLAYTKPIPLELLSLGDFHAPAQTRSLGLLKSIRGGGGNHDDQGLGGPSTQTDSRTVYPFTFSFIGQGQLGGQYTLWTDSDAARAEWKEKLQHAKVLRSEVNDAGQVFEMTPISQDTFYMRPNYAYQRGADEESPYTGRVTCSVPFMTVDGRNLVAIGCEEGVWIGLRHDPKSLRKVLHVRDVTNCAVLEEFGIFLVLADKSLLAYHLEALVPTAASPQVRSAPQRLGGGRDISFFSVGQIGGRTLVLYMKRKGIDSVFRVVEPILNRNMEEASRNRRFGSLLGQKTEWFRVYKDFFIPTEALHVHFLKAKLAIVCAKGFEIMDLTDLKGGTIPIFDPAKLREKPAIAELSRRSETAKPLGMFRSTESEFLLCYDSFGIYVDRHGEPNRDLQAIEWEGRPDSVVFHPPYLLLVSAPFIEVRHIDNAKLLQIYTGSDIRCTWDGTGGQSTPNQDTPGPKGYGDETSSQEPRIHICLRPEDAKRTKGIAQHVFELTPTLLLNNPLLNPVHTHDSNYFPPAPMMSQRPSSIITTNSEAYFGSGNGNGNMGYGNWNQSENR